MKKIVNWLLGSVLMIAAVTMLSSVSANASTYYHRTPTRATARKAYYTTDTKSHTFRANGNYNRWTFRANHDLKNYRNTVWTTTQQTDIISCTAKRFVTTGFTIARMGPLAGFGVAT
ncbi:hypothetical protein [Lactiplantibacillus plantarum]|uniref:hypothetical protein n=1 Tax=Lactiplantibacillus plantarum TaxID=1590 RepID=UPI0021C5E69A|nr:hypothetical protein [Lactiplantibacillus plantarum]